jgi:hypothetical protein
MKFPCCTAAILSVLCGVVYASPASAKAGDKPWTACVWSQAPDSAAAWLAMPVPTWQSAYTDANVLLGHRLIALCDATAALPLKPNRMPNWKSLAASLRRSKPKAQPTGAAGAASPFEVQLCRSSLNKDGRSFIYLYEIVRRHAGSDTVSFQQYYTEAEGQSLKLPQDLRIMPGESGGTHSRTCQQIGPKGELIDA